MPISRLWFCLLAATLSTACDSSNNASSDTTTGEALSTDAQTESTETCTGVDCSGHGQCEALGRNVFCSCDPGHMPVGLACVAQGDRTVFHAIDSSGINTFDLVDKVQWMDSKGLPRVAYFAKKHTQTMFPDIAGYITRLDVQPDAASPVRRMAENLSGINAAVAQGWGINIMHYHYTQNEGFNPLTGENHTASGTKLDGFDFEQEPVFLGDHHLIFRTSYKQYTTMIPGTLQSPGPDDRKTVLVVIDWVFFSGMDHFIYALTIDSTEDFVADDNPFRSDVRTPYCQFFPQSWDGLSDWTGGADLTDGQSWGDHKKFFTYDLQSWVYGEPNTIPYVWEWVNVKGDAETGLVQTETYDQKQAGSEFNGGESASDDEMPSVENEDGYLGYSFQMNYYDNYQGTKLTWGLPYGAIDGGRGSTPGYQNYSVAAHFGKYTEGGIPRLIAETEAIHDGRLQLAAIKGSLVTSGPEGSANPTAHLYSPPGFNPVYRTFEIAADNGEAVWKIDSSVGFQSPVFVVWSRALAESSSLSVTWNGTELSDNQGCLISKDPEAGRVFITISSLLSGSNTIAVGP